jgi:hypothetical protein
MVVKNDKWRGTCRDLLDASTERSELFRSADPRKPYDSETCPRLIHHESRHGRNGSPVVGTEDELDDAGPGRIITSLSARGLGRCAGRRGHYWQ